jgi:putative salt-induced outer membrane protein YdiY
MGENQQTARRPSTVAIGLTLAALAAGGAACVADEEEALGWTNKAELSLVSTRGNSETDTLGFGATLVRNMPHSTLSLNGRGLRAGSTSTSRRAVGTSPEDYDIVETTSSLVTAEQYSLGARYEAEVSRTLFWHIGLRWERHELAGFGDRVSGAAGVGHEWWDGEGSRFRTDYALTYTSQTDLVPMPGLDDTFLGLRVSYDFWRRLTATTELGSTLVVDHNLDESEDLRGEATNWLSVAINDRLALKLSLEILYDDLPALGILALELPDGAPTGDTVTFPLEEMDTLITLSLVVDF